MGLGGSENQSTGASLALKTVVTQFRRKQYLASQLNKKTAVCVECSGAGWLD